MSFFKGSMELPEPEKNALPPDEDAVLEKLAKMVVKRGFSVPAIMFLESIKPLNYITSQALVFLNRLYKQYFLSKIMILFVWLLKNVKRWKLLF